MKKTWKLRSFCIPSWNLKIRPHLPRALSVSFFTALYSVNLILPNLCSLRCGNTDHESTCTSQRIKLTSKAVISTQESRGENNHTKDQTSGWNRAFSPISMMAVPLLALQHRTAHLWVISPLNRSTAHSRGYGCTISKPEPLSYETETRKSLNSLPDFNGECKCLANYVLGCIRTLPDIPGMWLSHSALHWFNPSPEMFQTFT